MLYNFYLSIEFHTSPVKEDNIHNIKNDILEETQALKVSDESVPESKEVEAKHPKMDEVILTQ